MKINGRNQNHAVKNGVGPPGDRKDYKAVSVVELICASTTQAAGCCERKQNYAWPLLQLLLTLQAKQRTKSIRLSLGGPSSDVISLDFVRSWALKNTVALRPERSLFTQAKPNPRTLNLNSSNAPRLQALEAIWNPRCPLTPDDQEPQQTVTLYTCCASCCSRPTWNGGRHQLPCSCFIAGICSPARGWAERWPSTEATVNRNEWPAMWLKRPAPCPG